MSKKLLFIFILLVFSISVFSLSLEQGRLKLSIDDDSGMFQLKYTDEKDQEYSFFYPEDMRTTFFNLYENDRSFTLGQGSVFNVTVTKSATGASVVYENELYQIIFDYKFIVSKNAIATNGLQIDVTIRNVSEKSAEIGFLTLFDTYLGEKKGHFYLPTGAGFSSEKEFKEDKIPAYFLSKPKEGVGIMVMTGLVSGVTRPDRLIFANWKRLEENLWNFEHDSKRDFNLPPYSFNDSAAALYYAPQILGSQDERKITMVMGIETSEGYYLGEGAGLSPISEIIEDSEIYKYDPKTDRLESLKKEYQAILDLLNEIDKKIENWQNLSEEEITVLKELIIELENRKKHYLQ